MNTIDFPTNLSAIKQRVASVDPVAYGKTRNFLSGAVTRLSPYLSRGIISLPQVTSAVLENYTVFQSEKLLQELAWREYYQRVWQVKEDLIFTDLKQEQTEVDHHQMPEAILHAATGISAIDEAIERLGATGYMHNHLRMYTAMLSCNIAKAHWAAPAQWMYYYLLDGDLASNALSWQWVAGSFSSKKYVANQENINRYTGSNQLHTFLSVGYDAFQNMQVPDILKARCPLSLSTHLPVIDQLTKKGQKLFVYNSYQLDPEWHKGEEGTRVLLLEPSHFEKYPVSERVLQFVIDIASNNIPEIQLFTGSFHQLIQAFPSFSIYYKEHPLTKHYSGIKEERNWMFPEVTGYYPSFFSYWKKCEKYMR
jgi:deoxyribodipyrimidine photo-lyase